MRLVEIMVIIMLLGQQTSYSSAASNVTDCVDGKVSITENKDIYCQLGCAYSTCAAKPNPSQEEAKGCIKSCSKMCTQKH
ncbi:hypothetical protein MKW94_005703 [Papaver nudicaule]|uniref:Thionin-like protein n=1 Tax=Papaver nudicaule TaxID=74823 RepID=A0AA41V4S9_PAPNU|nr:hypothetical protein [Papaver nudicaule]